jgi:hypothetical protein
MEWLSVFILAGLLCVFAQGWTITDIQVQVSPSHSPPPVVHSPSRVSQLELSQYAKTGSLCLGGGMIALLVAERMLRDFATSTVFESGAGA